MKVDLRISIKDYIRNKNFKIQLTQVPFAGRASLPPLAAAESE
jgi:hypothetical protein